MIQDTFDEVQVAVVNGGIDLAIRFPSLPWNHLTYTGSGAVGRKVMQAAAKNLVPVTLELGGKCPVVVDKDSITNETIAEIAGVKVVKRGQMCVTVDYCLVPEKHLEEFSNKMVQHFKKNFSENNGAAHSCGIISNQHIDRLQGLIDDARAKSQSVTQIGSDLTDGNRNMPFYIIVNPAKDTKLMQEEIFGPILPIIPYKNVQDAINYINDGGQPLGLYIYSKDNKFVNQLANNTQSGGVAVNFMALQAGQPSLPFGGIGESGMGHHHGEEGFKEFSNPRGYFVKGKGGTFPSITPPYDDSTDYLINEVAYASVGKQLIFALKTLPKNIVARLFG